MKSTNANNCTWKIGGMDCPSCASKIENKVSSLYPDAKLSINIIENTLSIEGSVVDNVTLKKHLTQMGYKPELTKEVRTKSNDDLVWMTEKRNEFSMLLTSTMVMTLAIFTVKDYSQSFGLGLMFIGLAIAGKSIFRQAFYSLKTLRLDMNALMTIAVIGAMILGEWFEAGAIVILFSVAELLEKESLHKSKMAIESLVRLKPDTAILLINEQQIVTEVININRGDVILVKPGEVIPVDGKVLKGESSVNEASITGESMPVYRGLNSLVKAGSLNGEGALIIEVTNEPGDTTLDKIIKLVKNAQSIKSKRQTFIEKFATVYTPIIVGLAVILATAPPLLLGLEWSDWVYRALTLFVISCPCALVITTPVTNINSITGAAKRGVLFKNGISIELLHKVKHVAFDKTGTLTEGKMVVKDIVSFDGLSTKEIVTLAASLEMHSEHPIGKAFNVYAAEHQLALYQIEDFKAIPGKGASAVINGENIFVGSDRLFQSIMDEVTFNGLLANIPSNIQSTLVFIGNNKRIFGYITLEDKVKSNAFEAITQLKDFGINSIAILSGDNEQIVGKVGAEVGISNLQARLTPIDKTNLVKQFQKEIGSTAMIGDGINDAPALAAADVGIAMGGSGNDAALETAEVVLMSDNLNSLVSAFRYSKRTNQIIKQNIFISLATKFIFVGLAGAGMATLWMAVLADVGLAMLVVVNSIRARTA